MRESGEYFRIGSLVDSNEITATCTRITASGIEIVTTRLQDTINEGQYSEFKSISRADQAGLGSSDYRREFCCVETSKPAIVMQYSLGHSVDEVSVAGLAGQQGDPAMSLVPPIEQYRNSYIVTTAERGPFRLNGFMSWAIPVQFFDPVNSNSNNFSVNGTAFDPPSRNAFGSGGYLPIRCQAGEVCGYGAFGQLASGVSTISYGSSSEPNPGMYASVYGLDREISFAYPAGYECEPIGRELPT